MAIAPAAAGDSVVFALSLAATRVVLAAAHAANARLSDILRLRITRSCLLSALLFGISCVVPSPFRYLLWAAAILIESGALLAEDRAAAQRARRQHDLAAFAPADPAERLDPHHFAERFGLFLIILIGEVVVEVGQASVDGHVASLGGWAALVGAMVLAGGLWWLYFDSAAEVNLRVLELSGGSPTMARAIFATGHQLPAFALLITAAGLGLLLEEEPPDLAAKLACCGIAIYLIGTRTFLHLRGPRRATLARALIALATFQLWRLAEPLGAHGYVWLLAAWVVVCAALTTRTGDSAGQRSADARLALGRAEA